MNNNAINPKATPPSDRKKPASSLASAFYMGTVFHKRVSPKVHAFRYPLYMTFLDLDEVDFLDKQYWWFSKRRWAPLQFKSTDYFRANTNMRDKFDSGSMGDFKQATIALAATLGANTENINRVCMLAQLRCFGIYFSPVNFYFLYTDKLAKYVIAEVSNTPWNNTHCYLVDLKSPTTSEKCFHVSPFMDLDMSYRWRVKAPTTKTSIHIENWSNEKLFTAVFSAKRHEIERSSVRAVFLRWPVITLSIVKAIYWQACKLFFKGIKYVPYQNQPVEASTTDTDNTRSHS